MPKAWVSVSYVAEAIEPTMAGKTWDYYGDRTASEFLGESNDEDVEMNVSQEMLDRLESERDDRTTRYLESMPYREHEVRYGNGSDD